MQRYEPEDDEGCAGYCMAHDDGDYVLHSEAQARIEQLERELADSHKAHEHTSFMLGTKLSELTAEKALADRLAECVRKLWAGPAYIEMVEDVEEEYRKARGL